MADGAGGKGMGRSKGKWSFLSTLGREVSDSTRHSKKFKQGTCLLQLGHMQKWSKKHICLELAPSASNASPKWVHNSHPQRKPVPEEAPRDKQIRTFPRSTVDKPNCLQQLEYILAAEET